MAWRNDGEEVLQRSVVELIERVAPRLLFWHVPNGGSRNLIEARKLKGMGTRAGVPDLVFVLATGVAAFWELKHGDGKQSSGQREFQRRAEERGCEYYIVRQMSDAVAILEDWRRRRVLAPPDDGLFPAVGERADVRMRGVDGRTPWRACLCAMTAHLHVYVDGGFWTERDVDVLEGFAKEIRRRVEGRAMEVNNNG